MYCNCQVAELFERLITKQLTMNVGIKAIAMNTISREQCSA